MTETDRELPPAREKATQALFAKAKKALAAGKTAEAEKAYLAAWELIPEPRLEYGFAYQTQSWHMVDFYREAEQFAKARKWLDVMRKAYGNEDASVMFLSAQVDHDAGDLDAAFATFDALYKLYKKRPFQEDDPKYLKFYEERRKKGAVSAARTRRRKPSR